MPGPRSFDYAVVRIVPRVEREEFLNAGVILYCLSEDFLGAKVELDRERLRALDPSADADAIEEHLRAIPRLCAGGEQAGPIGQLSQRERWHWLVSPKSTVIQTSPVHSGLAITRDPHAELERLFDELVRPPGALDRRS